MAVHGVSAGSPHTLLFDYCWPLAAQSQAFDLLSQSGEVYSWEYIVTIWSPHWKIFHWMSRVCIYWRLLTACWLYTFKGHDCQTCKVFKAIQSLMASISGHCTEIRNLQWLFICYCAVNESRIKLGSITNNIGVRWFVLGKYIHLYPSPCSS